MNKFNFEGTETNRYWTYKIFNKYSEINEIVNRINDNGI